jgi:hypothetical protein
MWVIRRDALIEPEGFRVDARCFRHLRLGHP